MNFIIGGAYQGKLDCARTKYNLAENEIFTCTEVGSGKDRPYIFQRAMEHLQTDRKTTAVVEDAYHAIHTAKQDGFLVVGVYDSHESRQQELLRLSDVFLSDYFDLTSFWKFVSAE